MHKNILEHSAYLTFTKMFQNKFFHVQIDNMVAQTSN